MKDILKQYLKDNAPPQKENEIEEILSIFKAKEFKKGDYFKEPYKAGKEICFLAKGAIRVFVIDDNGDDNTLRIREENHFIMDMNRLEHKDPSPIGIECLEQQSLLVTNFDDFIKLLETNFALNVVVRKYITLQILDLGKQHLLFLTGSSKQRYDFILKENPSFLKKFPLRFIASMIGITPTQLSRVRNKK